MIDFVELKLYLCTNKKNVYIKNKTIIVFCVLFLKTKNHVCFIRVSFINVSCCVHLLVDIEQADVGAAGRLPQLLGVGAVDQHLQTGAVHLYLVIMIL